MCAHTSLKIIPYNYTKLKIDKQHFYILFAALNNVRKKKYKHV